MLFTSSPLALAQSSRSSHPGGFINNLQFVLNISFGNETAQPISPGETREVTLNIYYLVTRGLFGRWLLQLLEGKPLLIQLSIEDKPDWCEAWLALENITGVISGEPGYQYSSLFIHANESPGNYTLGVVKILGTIHDKKGPFQVFTLIKGFEHEFNGHFVTGP